MISEKKMTVPDPAVGAAGEQSSYVCATMILAEKAAEIKGIQKYGAFRIWERRANEQSSL